MLRLNKFKWFITKSPDFYTKKRDKIVFIYFGENTGELFPDNYEKLHLPPYQVKYVYMPRYIYKYIKLFRNIQDLQDIKERFGIVPSLKFNSGIIRGATLFDFTPIADAILTRLPHFRNVKAYNLFFGQLNLFIRKFKDAGYEVNLIYHINLNDHFSESIFYRKVYPILNAIKNNEKEHLLFDRMLLLPENNRKTYYQVVWDKKQLKYFKLNRFIQLFRSMKIIKDELSIEPVVSPVEKVKPSVDINKSIDRIAGNDNVKDLIKATQSVTTQVANANNKKLNNETAKNIIKQSDNNIVAKSSKSAAMKLDVPNNTKIKVAAASLNTVFNVKNDKKISNIIKSAGPNNIIKMAAKFSLPAITVINESTDPIVKKLDIKKIHQNDIYNNSLSKSKMELDSLDQMIKEIFNIYSNSEIPIKFKTLKRKVIETPDTEIEKSIYRNYEISLRLANDTIQKITFRIPEIIEDNYMLINGMKKVIIKQLIADPLYYPKAHIVFIHSVYATIKLQYMIQRKPFFMLYVAGIKLPFMASLLSVYGEDFVSSQYGINISEEKFNDNSMTIKTKNDETLYINFQTEESLKFKNDFYKFNNIIADHKVKDKPMNWDNVVIFLSQNKNAPYIIKQVFHNIIDNHTKEILLTNNQPTNLPDIFKYVIPNIINGYYQARNDLSKLRVRSFEIIYSIVKKIYALAYSRYKGEYLIGNKNVQLIFNSRKLMSMILTSSIVQNLEYVNPIEQVEMLNRVTYTGDGGIDKNAALLEMRGLNDSYYGNIDPVDTPQSGSIGMVQHLSNGITYTDKFGHIKIRKIDDNTKTGLLSGAGALIPFIENNEPTRIIMASNQMKQAISIEGAEPPAVATGYESIISNYCNSTFITRSEYDGVIEKVTDKEIIVRYNNGMVDVFKIGRQVLKSGQGYHSITYLKATVTEKEKVKAHQILAYNKMFTDGQLSTGRNLLCAFMPYKGGNFEDGIVLRKGIVDEGVLTSSHLNVYEIFINKDDQIISYNFELDQEVKKGHTLIKILPENKSVFAMYTDNLDEDEYNNSSMTISIKSANGVVFKVEVYCNHDKEKITGALKELVNKYVTNKKLIGKFKYKGETIQGTLIRISIDSPSKLILGDKLANRAGNKGVISMFEDDDKMPITPWGEKLDIIMTPLGIYGRINLQQVMEMYTSMIGKVLVEKMRKLPKDKFISLLDSVYKLLDQSEDKNVYKGIMASYKSLSQKDYDKVKEKKFFPIIIPPFTGPKPHHIKKIYLMLGLKTKYFLTLPEFNTKTDQAIPVGYVYFNKLEHLASKKLKVRSIGMLSTKTSAPQSTKSNRAQKIGEGDSWSLMSYGADKLIDEFFGLASDDVPTKNKIISDIIINGTANLPDEKKTNPIKELTKSYFTTIGLRYED